MVKKKKRAVRKPEQPQSIVSDELFIPNYSGEHTAGTTGTPINDRDIANKAYVDASGGAPEGTAVKSTGEGGGTKFLREDGDDTCSWQTPGGGGDVTAAINLTANTIVQGDDGAKGVKTSTATVAQIATNVTHVAGDGSDHANVATNTTHISSDGTNHANVVLNDTHRGLTNEHLDWTADLGATNINAANYTDTGDTTAHASFSQLDYASAGHTGFAPALGADDNYVTDAEKTVIGNTSGANTGDQAAGDFAHNSLTGLNDGTSYEHLTQTEKTNAATGYTHSQDNTQAHSDYLLNSGNDATSGTITAAGFTTTGVTLTGDHGTAATDQVVNVCYGTGDPPAANTTTIGALFVKYTA
jgi:hypothetical protein